MKRCAKCRNHGHNKRSCNKRRNPAAHIAETIYIKQTPKGKEVPRTTRHACPCGDICAAIVVKSNRNKQITSKWLNKCMECLYYDLSGESLTTVQGPITKKNSITRSNPEKCIICGSSTTGRKNYCLEHISHSSYAASLIKAEENRRAEIARVSTSGSSEVHENSIVCDDIIRIIRESDSASAGIIAKELQLKLPVVNTYLSYLEKTGKLRARSVSGQKHYFLP